MKKLFSNIHYAWFILVGLCLIVGVGKGVLNNSASLFLTPVSKDLGIGMGDLTLYMSVSAIVTMLFLPIAGKVMAKYDIRLVVIVSILLQAGAFIAFSFMNSVWGWYIFAVPLAVGGVFITVILGPVLINQWFKKSSGLALGILVASGGLIGAIVQPSVGKLIAAQGWRTGYIALGVVAIAIVIPTVLLLIKKLSPEKGLHPYGATEEENAQDQNDTTQVKGISMNIAKKSSAFYSLLFFFFFITSIASFTMHIPSYLVDKGYEQTFAANAMGVFMIGVVFGSLLIGVLNDKIGSKYTTIFIMVLGIVSISLLLFASASTVVVFVALVLFAFVTSSIGTLGPALTFSLFGSKDYSQIYATASMGLAIAGIFALPAYGYIFQFTGSYTAGMYAIIAMLVLNILCVIFAYRGKRSLEKAGHWN